MFYVLYNGRLDSAFLNLKSAEKYLKNQSDIEKYTIVKEVLSI